MRIYNIKRRRRFVFTARENNIGGVGVACVVAERFFLFFFFRTHQRRSRCLARGSDINDDGDDGEDDYGNYYNSTTPTPTTTIAITPVAAGFI